ncbi:MAG: response regulator, partial [Candidatus Eisenbacteria bacterium]
VKQSILLETLLDVFQPRRAIIRSYGPGARANPRRRRYKARVLVVDDDEASRSQITRVLVECGYDVTTAENGLVALGILKRKSFDLVLMDSDMPVMDGIAASRKIRMQARWSGLPILGMLSGNAAEKRRLCLDAGMDGSLRKPVYSDELLRAVGKWGARHETRAEAFEEADPQRALGEEPADRMALDVEKALVMLGGDHELFREVLSTFVASIPETMEALRKGAADGDLQDLKLRAHSLKGTAACVCAEAVRDTAQRIEILLEEGNLEEVKRALDLLRRDLEEFNKAAESLDVETQESGAGTSAQNPG